MRRYLAKISGRSLAQITRLIRRRYTHDDIALLAAVDAAHEGLSGPALRRILWREHHVYGKAAYQRLASLSASHIYNPRRTAVYRQHHVHHTRTRYPCSSFSSRPTQPLQPSACLPRLSASGNCSCVRTNSVDEPRSRNSIVTRVSLAKPSSQDQV